MESIWSLIRSYFGRHTSPLDRRILNHNSNKDILYLVYFKFSLLWQQSHHHITEVSGDKGGLLRQGIIEDFGVTLLPHQVVLLSHDRIIL